MGSIPTLSRHRAGINSPLRCPVLSAVRCTRSNGTARARVLPHPRRNRAQPAQPDTTPRPPMSPRRAFLTSLILPGYAQTVFGRDKAAMLFTVDRDRRDRNGAQVRASISPRRRGLPRDSVVATYQIDPSTGLAVIDPKTGLPVPETWITSRFTRRSHQGAADALRRLDRGDRLQPLVRRRRRVRRGEPVGFPHQHRRRRHAAIRVIYASVRLR